MTNFLERLLQSYNLSYEDYALMTRKLSLDDLEDYLNFSNIEKAKEKILAMMKDNKKIMIYGDYDCDGITSTSILVYTFKELNYPHVGYYIPSRYLNGYGINEEMVDAIYKKGYDLIITVDNGVAAYDALKKAKEYGMEVILTDHHETKETLPECYTIVHPEFKEDKSYLPECGAYVAFQLSRALLNKTDEYLLTLASLATISDMMPLKGYNRDIVRLGLEKAKANHYPQFNLLVGKEGIQDEKSFSFVCAPKINSLGRVLETTKVNKGVEYFVSKDLNVIKEIEQLIEFTNDKRKVITNEAASKIDLSLYENKKIIIDCFNDISEGLIGLIANKVLNEANKPCIIFTKDDKTGYLKGSARSLEGLPLVELFSKMSDLIVQFGGHALAGGIAIEEKNLPAFITKANEIASTYTIKEKSKLIIPCELEELNLENYGLIRSLAPYGEEFNEPYLSIKMPCKNISYISNGRHIKGQVNFVTSFIGFNQNKDFGRKGEVTLIGKLEKDNFKGEGYLSFKVEEVKC
jgi:single-stranded-DNA-specific exonuclease